MEEITPEGNSKQEIFITEDEDADDELRLVISDDKHTESPISSAVRFLNPINLYDNFLCCWFVGSALSLH